MSATCDVAQTVRRFIARNFLFRDDADGLSDSDSLLESRVIDSMGVLELVTFLETRFAIRVGDDEVVPENLDTVAGIAAFVRGKLRAGAERSAVAHAG